jgi:MGT family glycosyltransferase
MKHIIEELIQAFESFKPDILYIDTYDVLAETVAEKFDIPYAHASATVLLYFEKGIPPVGSGFDIRTPRRNFFKNFYYFGLTVPYILKTYLNEKKALKSIDPAWKRKNISSVSPYLFIMYTTDSIEYHRNMFIPQIYYVGPSILEPAEEDLPDFPWEKLNKDRPMVYIATGTLFSEFYKDFYKNTLEALREENFPIPVQVVMAMGKQELIDELGDIPSNFIVVPYAPQIKLLPKASVVVTHGGVNSVNEALIEGKPMLVVHCGLDRVDMGKRIVHKNAGLCFGHNESTVEKIQNAILQLLQEKKYAQNAEQIMMATNRCNGPDTAAKLILQLADTGKPVRRKAGAPITLETFSKFPDIAEQDS